MMPSKHASVDKTTYLDTELPGCPAKYQMIELSLYNSGQGEPGNMVEHAIHRRRFVILALCSSYHRNHLLYCATDS
jgi:hypothetical protein